MKPQSTVSNIAFEKRILTIRSKKVILDSDLAEAYGVTTKRLNEQVKRNEDRFPEDFMFQLSTQEWSNLKSQIVTSSSEVPQKQEDTTNWSQFATSSDKHRGAAYRPYAFTEHGALMAATVLSSPQAVKMSLFIIRAFVKLREDLAANASILKRLAEIDRNLLQHDTALRDIYRKLLPLLAPPPETPRRRIGFHADPDKPVAKARSIPAKT